MKRLLLAFILLYGFVATAQTSGTLTFTVDPVDQSGAWGTDHYLAIWIEDATNTFIKTKLKRADSHGTNSHLQVWQASSGGNTVDATTGASYSDYSTPSTISWDATDVAASLVADGTYNIWVEFTWSHGGSTTSTSYSFTKGPSADYQTPADQTYFGGVIIDWVPDGVGIDESYSNSKSFIYPNPAKEELNIPLNNINKFCDIIIENLMGSVVYKERIGAYGNTVKKVYLNNFAAGTYIIKVIADTNILEEKFIIE